MKKLKSGKILWLKTSSSPAQMSGAKPRRIDWWGGQELEQVEAEFPPHTSPSSGDWAGSPGNENTCSLVLLQPKRKARCHAHPLPRNNASINNCFNCM